MQPCRESVKFKCHDKLLHTKNDFELMKTVCQSIFYPVKEQAVVRR